jgi:hypothetical protein
MVMCLNWSVNGNKITTTLPNELLLHIFLCSQTLCNYDKRMLESVESNTINILLLLTSVTRLDRSMLIFGTSYIVYPHMRKIYLISLTFSLIQSHCLRAHSIWALYCIQWFRCGVFSLVYSLSFIPPPLWDISVVTCLSNIILSITCLPSIPCSGMKIYVCSDPTSFSLNWRSWTLNWVTDLCILKHVWAICLGWWG